MHHAVFMRVLERIRYRRRDGHSFFHGKLGLVVESRTQRFTLDERHDVVEQPAGGARIEQRQQIRVLEIGRYP